ncbi:MAG: amino acid ABC transporter permease [Eubacteriales bacterium]|nr:amino acid ABC transporter permease [Eubacteriales bacterium]
MDYAMSILPALLRGAVVSVELFVITLLLALPLGLPIALGEMSRIKPLSWLCKAFVFVFRGTPLMLQLFFFYFFFPIVLGVNIDTFPAAVLTFVLNYSAYLAEIYRGGINSIDKGQYEAASSLGLSRWQTTFDIVIPQAMRVVIPPVSNEAITLVKDTALASCISMAELMRVSEGMVNRDGSLLPYILAAGIYLVFTFFVTLILSHVEKRFSSYKRKEQ